MKQPPKAISRKLAEATALLQRGEFAAARAGFGAVLKFDPRNFDALHFAGIAAAQMEHPEEGEALIRRALEVNVAIPQSLPKKFRIVLSQVRRSRASPYSDAMGCLGAKVSPSPTNDSS